MEPGDLAVLGLAALVTSMMTAIAGVGGGIVLIAILLLYVEPVVAIPVHGAIQMVSNVSRTFVQRRHVDRAMVWRFCLLLVPGSWLGLQLLSAIPPAGGRLAIGAFVLVALWFPRGLLLGLHPDRLDRLGRFIGLGGVVGVLNMTFGAAGPFLGPFLRGVGLARHGIVGTFAACQSVGHAVKIALFGLAGFAFAEYALLIVVCMALVVAGTALGSRMLEHIREATFQRIYLVVLTLVALRLIAGALLEVL